MNQTYDQAKGEMQLQLAPDDGLAVIAMDNWLDLETVTGYPASFTAFDVMYTLLGIEPE